MKDKDLITNKDLVIANKMLAITNKLPKVSPLGKVFSEALDEICEQYLNQDKVQDVWEEHIKENINPTPSKKRF